MSSDGSGSQKICPECGAELKASAKVCLKCASIFREGDTGAGRRRRMSRGGEADSAPAAEQEEGVAEEGEGGLPLRGASPGADEEGGASVRLREDRPGAAAKPRDGEPAYDPAMARVQSLRAREIMPSAGAATRGPGPPITVSRSRSMLFISLAVICYVIGVIFLFARWGAWGSPGALLGSADTSAPGAHFWTWRIVCLLVMLSSLGLFALAYFKSWDYSRGMAALGMWIFCVFWTGFYRFGPGFRMVVQAVDGTHVVGRTERADGVWTHGDILFEELLTAAYGTGLFVLSILGLLFGILSIVVARRRGGREADAPSESPMPKGTAEGSSPEAEVVLTGKAATRSSLASAGFVVVVVIIVLLSGAAFVWLWRTSTAGSDAYNAAQKVEEEAGEDYERALEAYKSFLADHPKGTYARLAKRKVEQDLPQKIDQREFGKVDAEAQQARRANDYVGVIDAYRHYLKRFPKGAYVEAAKKALETGLPADAAAFYGARVQADAALGKKDYGKALEIYQAYLNKYPYSRCATEVTRSMGVIREQMRSGN